MSTLIKKDVEKTKFGGRSFFFFSQREEMLMDLQIYTTENVKWFNLLKIIKKLNWKKSTGQGTNRTLQTEAYFKKSGKMLRQWQQQQMAYLVPNLVLSLLYVLFHLIITSILWSRYYNPYFADTKISKLSKQNLNRKATKSNLDVIDSKRLNFPNVIYIYI